MTKKQKTVAWVIVLLLIGGGILWAWLANRPKVAEMKTPDGKPVTNGGSNFNDALNPDLVLKKGDAGNNVKALQEYINGIIKDYKFNLSSLVPDGAFGNYTEGAIKTITKGLYASTSLNGLKQYVKQNLPAPYVWEGSAGSGMSTPTYTGS